MTLSMRRLTPATLASVVVLAIGVTTVMTGQAVVGFFEQALHDRLPPIDQEVIVVTAPFDPKHQQGVYDLAETRGRIASALPGLTNLGLFRASYQPVRINDREVLRKVVGVDAQFFPVLGIAARSGQLRFRDARGAQLDCALSQVMLKHALGVNSARGELDVGGTLCRVVGILDLSDPFVAGRVDQNAIFVGFDFPAFNHGSSIEKGAVLSFSPNNTPTEATVKRKIAPLLGVEHLDYWSYRDELARNQRLLAVVTTATSAVALSFLLVVALNSATFVSHAVAQREKEIGLKRALGATRLAIFAEVQVEVALLGGVAFALGLGLTDWLTGSAAPALLDALTDLPVTPLQLSEPGIIAGLCAGILVPAAASMAPAIAAANISPAVALRSD